MCDDSIRTISEREAKEAGKNGLIDGGYAVEELDGFKLVFRVKGLDCHLSPRRDMHSARKFKRFEILTNKFRSIYPSYNSDVIYKFKEGFQPK